MLDAEYCASMRAHLQTLRSDLSTLQEKSLNGGLNRFEYLAVELNLQRLVESAVGIAKRLLKAEGERPADLEARQLFARLSALGVDTGEVNWPGAVGLRNVIVHDYLNVDSAIVYEVLNQGLTWIFLGSAKLK